MRPAAILVLLLALGVAAAEAARTATAPLPLSARLIQPGEFPGFLSFPGQATKVYSSPAKWVAVDSSLSSAQAKTMTARLRMEGFVRLLARQLGTATKEPWGGLSWVMELGSAVSAKAELAANVHDTVVGTHTPYTYRAFAVPGIPGAHGYRLGGGGGTGYNIVFADGRYIYLVGFGLQGTPKNPPTRARLISAATHLYRRVHGR